MIIYPYTQKVQERIFVDDSSLQLQMHELYEDPSENTFSVKQLYSQYQCEPIALYDDLEEQFISLQALAKKLEEAYEAVTQHKS